MYVNRGYKIMLYFTLQYLNVVKELSGYNSIAFPYCLSSVRHDGYVIPKLTFNTLEFVACSPMGEPEVYCILMYCIFKRFLIRFVFNIFDVMQPNDSKKK